MTHYESLILKKNGVVAAPATCAAMKAAARIEIVLAMVAMEDGDMAAALPNLISAASLVASYLGKPIKVERADS